MNKKSFTLAELMIAALILVMGLMGILLTFVRCIELDEISAKSFDTLQAMRDVVENVRSTPYNRIFPSFNNQNFVIDGIPGMGAIYIDNTNPRLISINVVFCLKLSKGYILGEDRNLNGVLDKNEDKNNNKKIDSPLELFTYLFYRK